MKKIMKNSWNNSRHSEVPNVTQTFSYKNNPQIANTNNNTNNTNNNIVCFENEIKKRRMSHVSVVSSDSLVSLIETSPLKSKSQTEISDNESIYEETNNQILIEDEKYGDIKEYRKSNDPSRIVSSAVASKLNKHKSSNENIASLGLIHVCKECSRTFKDVNNYKEHRFQEHHVTEYQNVRKCSLCSYATLLKSKFDCHTRCHLNNKVIKCQRCEYSTINIRHMSRHERMHMLQANPSIKPLFMVKTDGISESQILDENQEIKKNKMKVDSDSHQLENYKKRKINEQKERSDNNSKSFNKEVITANFNSKFSNLSVNQSDETSKNIDFNMVIHSLNQYEDIKKNNKLSSNEQMNCDQVSTFSLSQSNRSKCNYNEATHSPNLITPPSSTTSCSSSSDIHSPNSFQNSFQNFDQNGQFGEPFSHISCYEDAQPKLNLNSSSNFYSVSPFEYASKMANSGKNLNIGLNESTQTWNLINECSRENKNPTNNMYCSEQTRQFEIRQECCSNSKLCSHKQELQILRRNIFFLLQNLAPQLIYSLKLNSNSDQIDKIVEYLSTQIGPC